MKNKGFSKFGCDESDMYFIFAFKDLIHESSLYAFLGRVRLNIALDALREVRCVARSADRSQMVHAMLYDAVQAHHRRSQAAKRLNTTIIRTFGSPLDDQVRMKNARYLSK